MKLVVMREFIILKNMKILISQQLTTKRGKLRNKIKLMDITDKVKKANRIKLI